MAINNDPIGRFNAQLARLGEMVEQAKAAAEMAAPVSDFIAGLRKLTNSVPKDDEGKVTLADALGDNLSAAVQLVESASSVLAAIGAKTGTDRTEGDQIAKAIEGALAFYLVDGEDADAAQSVVDAWKATAGKVRKASDGSTRAPSGKTLDHDTVVKCEAHNWTARASAGQQLNSLRWTVLDGHHKTAHGHKPGKGEAIWQGLTDAITAVQEGAQTADGGGYLVSQSS